MLQSCPSCYGVNKYNAIFCKHCLEPLIKGSDIFGESVLSRLYLPDMKVQKSQNPETKGDEGALQ